MKKILLIFLVLSACCSGDFDNPHAVRHAGVLRQIMQTGDISAKAALKDLKDLPHLYAIGSVENLKGEIQVFDGIPWVTTANGEQASVDNSFDNNAALLVWTQVDNWQEITIPKNIHTFEQVEALVQKAAEENGLDTQTPFPFLLDGTMASLNWHIINWKDGDKVHSHEKHVKSGLHGKLENVQAEILGFYSNHHHGIFTHHSTNIHAHFRTENAPYGGHIDDLELGKQVVLKLPLKKYLMIQHATLPNLDNLGETKNDLQDACVLIKNNTIEWVGPCSEAPNLPEGTEVLDASGKYVIPGLFDGFAALNNQAYCNAYLYMGITNIIAVDGGRRGGFYAGCNPSPNIYRLEGIGQEKIPSDSLMAQIDALHKGGYKVLLLMYGLTPQQLELAIKKASELGMATIGELGYTTYKEGMRLGLDAVVHTTRYSLDVAPPDMVKAVADEPFSNDLNSPKWRYYKFLTQLKKDYQPLQTHAENIGNSNTFIMPTSSLSYLDLPDHDNPWDEPIAKILDSEDINRPANPTTGNHSIDSLEQAAYTNLILNELKNIEPAYYQHGAKYLAGSGTDVWGTMPGISLHHELQLLHEKVGLTNREAIAAATTNFSAAFGWKNGKIEKGYPANILILNKNPLRDLQNLKDIYLVILNGEVLARDSFLK